MYKRWVKIEGERNEGWDLLVYNYAAAIRLGVNRWGEANWLECERILTQTSLFAAPAEAADDDDPYCVPPDLGDAPPAPDAGTQAVLAEVPDDAAETPPPPPREVARPTARAERPLGAPLQPPARPVAQPVRRAVARSAYLR